MRRLFWLAIVFSLLWSGWWFFAAQSLQVGLTQWLAERRAEGWQAETSNIRSAGFPMRLEKTLVAPALADPDTGVAFTTGAIVISAPAWWPGYVTVSFPSDEIALASPEERHLIASTDARADLRLKPGSALELEELALASGAWSLTTPAGSLMAAQGLALRMALTEDAANTYDFAFDAPAFQLGSVPREVMHVPSDWPIAFDSLTLDATITFDRTIDRTTIEVARPQPKRIDLQLAEAVWGALLLRASATLDVSAQGVLSGEVSLQARNWQALLSLAETAGIVPPVMLPQLDSILGALARGSGNPDTLDVAVTLRDGTIYLGFIPLGIAPQLILH